MNDPFFKKSPPVNLISILCPVGTFNFHVQSDVWAKLDGNPGLVKVPRVLNISPPQPLPSVVLVYVMS